MAIVAKWGGAGLSAGTVLNNTTSGTGDNHFDTVTNVAGTFTIRSSGLYPPRIEMVQQTGQAAQFYWQATLGTIPAQNALRFYNEYTAYPSGNTQLYSIRDASNVPMWWLDVTPAGILRLRNTGGTAKALSVNPLPLNTVLRFEAVANADAVTVYVYPGESLTPIETLAGTGFDTTLVLVSTRFGNTNTSPIWPTMYWDNLAFANTADLIGPVTPPPPSAFKLWNGTTEAPLTVAGVWNGTAIVPLGTPTVK